MSQASKLQKSAGRISISNKDGLKINGVIGPQFLVIPYHFDENGSDATLFISDRDYEIVSVQEAHTVAGTDGGAVSAMITKCTGTQSPSAGTSVLQSVFNLKALAGRTRGSLSAMNECQGIDSP